MSKPKKSSTQKRSTSSRLVAKFAKASKSESTRRSYAQDIRHYRQHAKWPPTPDTVAAYIANFAGALAVSTLAHRLIAIHRWHAERGLESPVRSPLVKQTMQGIRRTFGVAQRRMQALVKDDLTELLVTVAAQKPMKAARDSALLLVGFAGAFRRSELVGLNVADMTMYEHGIELLLRRSKTDQEGEGRTVFVPKARSEARCPVRALRHWLEFAGITEGPLFRAVNRHDQVIQGRALTAQSVALVVKSVVGKAKGPEAAKRVAGHSLRAGFVTEAAMVGIPLTMVMQITGHKSTVMALKYFRPVQKRQIQSLL